MLDKLLEPSSLAVIAATTVQFALFLRWLYRRVRNDELMRAFVADMATSHLPHIYDLLARLCDQRGIKRPSAPPICWIDLNGKTR
ncbi:MAG: hypothetical protein ACRD4H_01565 [Candidatus Acidiferrales bacterium]